MSTWQILAIAAILPFQYHRPVFAQTTLKTLEIEKIEVNGSTVFDSEDLAAITAPLIGKRVTLEEILELRTTITNLYIKRGYLTSGAFFPLQDSSDGTVRIQAIEGELEEIEITGLSRLTPGYVKSRLKLAANSPLNVRALERSIQLLQQSSLIDTVNARLVAGTAPGLSKLKLQLSEAPQIITQLSVSNDESPNLGEYKATAAIAHQNLLGYGDRLAGEYSLTEGINEYNFQYSLPINARDGGLFIGYSNNNSEIIDSLFTSVDIQAQSRSSIAGWRQPIIKNPRQELALSLALNLRTNETFLDEESFAFDIDRLGESGKSKTTALRLEQEWLSRSTKNIWAVSSQFSLGIDAFDATVSNSEPDSQFFSWLGQFQWLRALDQNRDAKIITRIAMQITSDPLLPSEQFALGGLGSVRGYEQNQVVGDNGILGSVEVQIPLVGNRGGIGKILLTPFVDGGTVWSDRASLEETTLASLGVGINWEFRERLFLQAYYGIPLLNAEDSGTSLQADGIHFSLQLVPFKF